MPNWTPEQQTAIDARCEGLILSAAAGSGKTAVLTERAVRMITDPEHPVDVDRMLIVTFTRAAALEMRSRIQDKLSERLIEQPNNEAIRRQMLLLPHAQISTIDGYCNHLVQTYGAALGIAPDFQIADEVQLQNLKERAADEVIEGFYAKGDPAFHALVELLSSPRDDRNLVNTLLQLHNFILSHPFPDEWLDRCLANYDPAIPAGESVFGKALLVRGKEIIDHAVAQNQKALRLCEGIEVLEKAYGLSLREDETLLLYLQRTIHSGDWDPCNQACADIQYGKLKAVRGYEGPEKEQIQELRKQYKKSTDKLSELFGCDSETHRNDMEELQPLMACLIELCRAFTRRYAALKEERSWMDYADLEHNALRLLFDETHQPTNLCRELSERYEQVMVDEYQDCNEAQDMLFRAVSDNGRRLFVVGDIKQSIYGFRQAMPEIFLRRLADSADYTGEPKASRLFLSANFRSAQGVVDAVNLLFGQLMSRSFGGIDYDHTQQLRFAADRPVDGPAAELHLVDMGGASMSAVECEAQYLADLITELLESDRQLLIRGEMRRIQPGDIAILLRSPNSCADLYVKALQKVGYDCSYAAEAGCLDAREVQTVLSLLRVIDNPLQDLPLLSLMLSALYHFSSDDVVRIRQRAPEDRLYRALLAAEQDGDPRCAALVQDLRKFRRMAATCSTPELLQRIYRETGYLALMQAAEQGEQRVDNLLLLVEYAARFDDSGGSTLGGFLRFLDRVLDRGGDLKGAQASATENAVQIMSIHRSKGLQFPVCIVANTAHQFNFRNAFGRTHMHAKLGFSSVRRGASKEDKSDTIPQKALAHAIRNDILEEELRLLYVAATRAESLLYFTAAVPDANKALQNAAQDLPDGTAPLLPHTLRGATSFLHWLLPAYLRTPGAAAFWSAIGEPCRSLPNAPVIPCKRIDGSLYETTKARIKQRDKTTMPAHDPQQLQALSERLSYRYPYEAIRDLPAKMTVTQIAKGETGASAGLRRPRLADGMGFTAAERGTLLHRYMQFADFRAAQVDARAELLRLVERGYYTEAEAKEVNLSLIRRFLRNPLCEQILSAAFRQREFQFLRMAPVTDLGMADLSFFNEQIVVQGMVDCIFGDEKQLICVDYKSDRITDIDAFLDRYRPQLALYKEAVAEAFARPVTACLIYSFDLDRVFRVL